MIEKYLLLSIILSVFILNLSGQDPSQIPPQDLPFEGNQNQRRPAIGPNRYVNSESSIFMYPGFRFQLPSFNQNPFEEMMRNNPFGEMESMMNKMFETKMEPLLSTGFGSAFGDISINNETFEYTVSMNGFKPNEIKIKIDGDNLIISGEQEKKDDNDTVIGHKKFLRTYTLPIGYQKDTIKSVFDGNQLKISGQRELQPTQEPMEIPIEFTESPLKQQGEEERGQSGEDNSRQIDDSKKDQRNGEV